MSDQDKAGDLSVPGPVPPSYGFGFALYRKVDPSWNDDQQLCYTHLRQRYPRLNFGATLSTTMPSPLDRAEIEPVLLALAAHPQYKNFTIVVHDRNYDPVTLRAGELIPHDESKKITPPGTTINVVDMDGRTGEARIGH